MTEEVIERRARLAARVQASLRDHAAVKTVRYLEILDAETGEAVEVGVVLRRPSALREVQAALCWSFPGFDMRVVLEDISQAATGGPKR